MNGPWRRGYVALGSNLGNREAALESTILDRLWEPRTDGTSPASRRLGP